ncbi:MAG: hypothetical protein V7L23_30155 [Nostoc sp.]|uniref:hypothetical protein n=1 Tax=Nostoc sp. TaxID=1180 RepID=UPI002FEF407C
MSELKSENQAGGQQDGEAAGSGRDSVIRGKEGKPDLLFNPDSRETPKGEGGSVGDSVRERIDRADSSWNRATGDASEGVNSAGGINSHLIEQCRKQLRKNKRQIARIDEDIARLQQDKEFLEEDNIETEEQLQKLQANQVAIES